MTNTKKKDNRYSMLKFTLKEVRKKKFDIPKLDHNNIPGLKISEFQKRIVKEDFSLIIDQLKIHSGEGVDSDRRYMDELIAVEAPNDKLVGFDELMDNGFKYDGIRYVYIGGSSSKARVGVSVFIKEDLYEPIWSRTLLGLEVDHDVVIPKFEAYRNLVFSSCIPLREKMPYIIIVDEYKKVIPNQLIRYAVEEECPYTCKETNEVKTTTQRVIKEGYKDVEISPFDGMGVHTRKLGELFAKIKGLDYVPLLLQPRGQNIKGISCEVNFKKKYKDDGITRIKDVYGKWHNVEDIDAIWNTSMFKGHGFYSEKFKDRPTEVWNEYLKLIDEYQYTLGISKYSHHIKNMTKASRMNFQFLQVLDLWNPKYIDYVEKNVVEEYGILDESNFGKMLNLGRETFDMYEKIFRGDKFTTLKFLGYGDKEVFTDNSVYESAIMINEDMMRDPAVRNSITSKLNKAIKQTKYGKIFVDGMYHVAIGDLIGYLEFCAGQEVVGCLKAGEFYSDIMPRKKLASFRAPLIDQSEVNIVQNVHNEQIRKYLSNYVDQDFVMVNMYDISMPQQGGFDLDGDILFLTDNELIIKAKINSLIVVDMEDKRAAKKLPYTRENIIKAAKLSRDSKIGEITNLATSFSNRYPLNQEQKERNDNIVSKLRLTQGKEIDYQKTGFRWSIERYVKKLGEQIPYYLLYRYPDKMNKYTRQMNENRIIKEKNEQIKLQNEGLPEDKKQKLFTYITTIAYKSASPLNELCHYVEAWEKKMTYDKYSDINDVQEIREHKKLLLDPSVKVDSRVLRRKIKMIIEKYSMEKKKVFNEYEAISKPNDDQRKERAKQISDVIAACEKELKELNVEGSELDFDTLANYCIDVCYSSLSFDKSLCWSIFGETILSNLRMNSPKDKAVNYEIVESPESSSNTYKFLGRYYTMSKKGD